MGCLLSIFVKAFCVILNMNRNASESRPVSKERVEKSNDSPKNTKEIEIPFSDKPKTLQDEAFLKFLQSSLGDILEDELFVLSNIKFSILTFNKALSFKRTNRGIERGFYCMLFTL